MKTGFKAFNKGLKCRDLQYEENKEYKIKCTPVLCENGFHYCENPLDTLDYYDLCDSEFAEIEDHGKSETDGNKTVTNHIKIKAKLDFKGFVKASIDFLFEKIKIDDKIQAASGNYSQLAASGDSSKLAASGNYSQLAASGNYSKLAASGDSSKLAASGYSSQLAASGNYSQLAASGYSSKLAASGYSSKLAASGDSSQLAASGDSSQLAASGNYSQLAASGDSSQLAASGYSSKLAASGDYSKLEMTGEKSVGANIGENGIAKGKIGCWITLAEYDYERNPICVKSAKIDGKKLKADTWYALKDKKFTEI